jgi:hypothetical protein
MSRMGIGNELHAPIEVHLTERLLRALHEQGNLVKIVIAASTVLGMLLLLQNVFPFAKQNALRSEQKEWL